MDDLDGSLRDSIVLTAHRFEDFGDVAQGGDLIQEGGLGGKQTTTAVVTVSRVSFYTKDQRRHQYSEPMYPKHKVLVLTIFREIKATQFLPESSYISVLHCDQLGPLLH